MLTGGCLRLALGAAEEMARRASALGAWRAALEDMKGELAFRLPDMPQLLEGLARRAASPAAETFAGAGQELDRLGVEPFCELWRQAVEGCNALLSREEREDLCRLGEVLGRYGWEDQRQAVEQVERRLAEREDRLRRQLRREGRTYGTLGLALGGFLTILLL